MAVSGSGGWIPSLRYSLDWQSQPVGVGITQNKEREFVYSDITQDCAGNIEAAARLIVNGTPCNIDVRYLQVVKLKACIHAIQHPDSRR